MAADAALLQEAQSREDAVPTVRVYTWDGPCVSIGRLQDEAAVRAAFPSLPLVRRPTGGRAVRHGDDLCVTVAARLSCLPPRSQASVLATHRLFAGALVEAFCALGTPAEFGGETQKCGQGGNVDCFAVACRCDIVDACTGRKLAGCAQRRAGGAVLQQMSIPWAHLPASQDTFLVQVHSGLAAALEA